MSRGVDAAKRRRVDLRPRALDLRLVALEMHVLWVILLMTGLEAFARAKRNDLTSLRRTSSRSMNDSTASTIDHLVLLQVRSRDGPRQTMSIHVAGKRACIIAAGA